MTTEPKTVYAVFRRAVYRHQCGGVFESQDEAVKCANDLADEDIDNHHTYEVTPFALGGRSMNGSQGWGRQSPEILEANPVYETRKGA